MDQRQGVALVNLAAQPPNVDIDDIGQRVFIGAPNVGQNALAAEQPAGRGHEQFQQRQFARGERHRRAAARGAHGFQVELQVGDLEHAGRARGLQRAAPAERFDPGQELFKFEGLDQVVVSAQTQASHPVFECAERGQHQDRQGHACCPQRLAHLQPVHSRQHHVQKHHACTALGVRSACHGQTVRAIAGKLHTMTLGTQTTAQEIRDARVILDDQNVHALSSSRLGSVMSGKRSVARVPRPISLTTPMMPPCARAKAPPIASPSPVPSAR